MTTSEVAAAQQQVQRPPDNISRCVGRRATTITAEATVEQQQGRRLLRVPCSTSILGGRPLVRPPPRKRDKGGGCRRPALRGRHRELKN